MAMTLDQLLARIDEIEDEMRNHNYGNAKTRLHNLTTAIKGYGISAWIMPTEVKNESTD